jgi:hypothetical protein
MQETMINM